MEGTFDLKSEKIRNLILDSAIELFMEKGYHNTSTNEIRIKANNLSRGGLYHYFPKKEDILTAIPAYLNQNDDTINQLLSDSSMTIIEKIRQIFIYNSTNYQEKKAEYQYKKLLQDYAFKEIHEKFIKEQIIPLYISLLEQGNLDGSLKVKHPKYLAPILFEVLNHPIINPDAELENTEEMREYLHFIKDFLDDNGMPLIDDTLEKAFQDKITQLTSTND